MSVMPLLPLDILRQYAYVLAVDAPIVIATSSEEAGAPSNIGAPNPAGGYFAGGWSPPIRHNQALWVGNTSTTTATRVVVLVERSNA